MNVSCEECELPCELPRSEGCSHECSIGPCHPGRCPDCVQLTKVKCHCDTNFVYVECHSWNRAGKKEKELLKSCKVPCPRNVSFNQKRILLKSIILFKVCFLMF